jgi:LysM repeat protein
MPALTAKTYFVLSKLQKDGSYKPDIFFALHLPPTAISVSWRSPHLASPLFSGVHVESGYYRLGDLTIDIVQGLKRRLAARADGSDAIMDGKQRAHELREFLRVASNLMAATTHRLEFHHDPRKFHFEVMPSGGQSHSITNTDASRVGGASSSLSFVILQDLDTAISLLGTFTDALDTAERTIQQGLGYVMTLTEGVKQGIGAARKTPDLITNILNSSRQIIQSLGDAILLGRSFDTVPLDVIQSTIDLVDTARTSLIDPNSDRELSERHRKLQEEERRLLRILEQITKDGRADTYLGSTSLERRGRDEFTTAKLALEDADDPYAGLISDSDLPDGGSGGFLGLPIRLATYSGWVPYTVKEGDSFHDIAIQYYGDVDLWMDIATVNDFSGSYELVQGQVIKLPVESGGFSWQVDVFVGVKAVRKALEEYIFKRDLKLELHDGLSDLVIDPQTGTDVLTVTGPDNYVQRYNNIVLRSELGDNPEFPGIGVYLGIGRKKTTDVFGMTYITARDQLLSDPRTDRLELISAVDSGDKVEIEFQVYTSSGQVEVLLGGVS